MNGKRHGHGIYTWADGRKEEGSYGQGKQHGKFVFTKSNGNMYVREYKDGALVRDFQGLHGSVEMITNSGGLDDSDDDDGDHGGDDGDDDDDDDDDDENVAYHDAVDDYVMVMTSSFIDNSYDAKSFAVIVHFLQMMIRSRYCWRNSNKVCLNIMFICARVYLWVCSYAAMRVCVFACMNVMNVCVCVCASICVCA